MAITPGIPNSARAQGYGIKPTFKNLRGSNTLLLPQRVAVIGQGSTASTYSTDKTQLSSAGDVAATYGFGSPLHLAALQLFPANGDGLGSIPCTFYPLQDDGSGAAASGDITPAGAVTKAGSFIVSINGIDSAAFTVAIGDTVADIIDAMKIAIDANLNMPVTTTDNTTDLGVTAKWKGVSSNDIVISVSGPDDTGVTFGITQPTGGLVNPSIQTALDQFGDDWETLVVNCMESTDTATLDLLSTFNEGRWLPQVTRPFVAFAGSSETAVNTAITVPDARPTDRTNSQPMVPGSVNLPLQIAAANVSRIARLADADPAFDYIRQNLPFIEPGVETDQWDYATKDQAIKAGTSSSDLKDNEVVISDTVTFYHPAGEQDPAYRYVVDIMKLMNIMYNINIIFDGAEWQGAPLIPDDQPTTNPNAKKPRMAKSALSSVIEGLGNLAIISDPDAAKDSILAEIDSQNPKRLNVTLTVQLAGNTNIKDIALNFGFYFGQSSFVA